MYNLLTILKAILRFIRGISDYVVEEGTSGIWTYIKWNSGKAECWGTKSLSSTLSTAWGNSYISSKMARQSYPFTFAARPIEQVTIRASTSSAVWVTSDSNGNSMNTTTQTGMYFATREGSASTHTLYFDYFVSGRWK